MIRLIGSLAAPLAAFVTYAFAQAPAPPVQPQQKLTVGFVEIEGDPRHEPIRAYERLVLKLREHPYAGAQVGIEEAAALSRVLKTDFALERITVKSPAEVATAVTQAREGKASVMIHPMDAAALDIADGDAVTLGNPRGETTLIAKLFDGVRRGVLIAESIHPNRDHIGGRGINMLTGAEAVAPIGGAAFHDNKVWVKRAAAGTCR